MNIFKLLCFIFTAVVLVVTTSSNTELEEGCFYPFETNQVKLFDAPAPHLWYVVGGNTFEDFLVQHSISAYITNTLGRPGMTQIPKNSPYFFTGRVFKFSPSLAGRIIGGNKNHIMLEVLVDQQRYVLLPNEMSQISKPSLKSRCTFE